MCCWSPLLSRLFNPAELVAARAHAEQQEFVLSAKRSELSQLLEEERLGRAEALMRQREQAEGARRALQVRSDPTGLRGVSCDL